MEINKMKVQIFRMQIGNVNQNMINMKKHKILDVKDIPAYREAIKKKYNCKIVYFYYKEL